MLWNLDYLARDKVFGYAIEKEANYYSFSKQHHFIYHMQIGKKVLKVITTFVACSWLIGRSGCGSVPSAINIFPEIQEVGLGGSRLQQSSLSSVLLEELDPSRQPWYVLGIACWHGGEGTVTERGGRLWGRGRTLWGYSSVDWSMTKCSRRQTMPTSFHMERITAVCPPFLLSCSLKSTFPVLPEWTPYQES